MITLRNVSKAFSDQVLLDEASLQINAQDRFALVGPNGAGKSTLFKLILGREEPDGGSVTLRTGVTFGYLPQETAEFHGGKVLDEVVGTEGVDSTRSPKAKKILMGLGFRQTDFERPVTELSGGWQMRIAIARLLVDEPDLLMLDEPTNHLDLETLLWFQGYLQHYRGAIFLISHDREFINSIVDRIVEVRDHKLNVYSGTFEDYLAQKKQEEENLISAYKRQQKEISELTDYINKFRAKASTASSVQSKIKYLDRMEKIVLPEELATVGFTFPQPARAGQNVLTLKNLRQSYDGKKWVYDGLDLTLERGQKIAFVGPNGAGKSTLLKILAAAIPFQEGERKLGYNVTCGYFSQHRAEMFRPGKTVLEEAINTGRSHSEQTVRTVLGSFLFRDNTVFKKVEVLSGGEKSRLVLAKILLNPPNFLLMDEPTTHLDMASIEALIQALRQYEGTLVFISHDVYFIKSIASSVLHVRAGALTFYPGNYDYYLEKTGNESAVAGLVADGLSKATETPGGSSPKAKGQKRLEADERQKRFRAKQEAREHLAAIEAKILKLEVRQKELTSFLEQPGREENAVHPAQAGRELTSVAQELEALSLQWERLVDVTQEI